MKKTIRIIYLTICGFLSIGFMLWAIIQAQEANHQRIMNQEWTKINKELLKNMDEYYNNMILLRNDSSHIIDIDSLFENSNCLKDLEDIRNELKNK